MVDLEEGKIEDKHTLRCSSPTHKMSDLQQKSLMKEMMTRVLTSAGTRLPHKERGGGSWLVLKQHPHSVGIPSLQRRAAGPQRR